MPRPGRGRAPRPTRSPSIQVYDGHVFETYNHSDDLPMHSDQPRRRPRHATRGATAAERRADLAALGTDRSPSPHQPHPCANPRPPQSNLQQQPPTTIKPRKETCSVCLRNGNKVMLLRCVACSRTVHSYCLNPPKACGAIPKTWTCQVCIHAATIRKKQGVKTFRDAAKNYSYLLSHKYLESITEVVKIAANSEAAITSLSNDDPSIDFAVPLQREALPNRPNDNTVILRIKATESELDDLPPTKPLSRRPSRSAKRSALQLEEEMPRNHDTLVQGTVERSFAKALRDDVPVKDMTRAKKKLRLCTAPSASTNAHPPDLEIPTVSQPAADKREPTSHRNLLSANLHTITGLAEAAASRPLCRGPRKGRSSRVAVERKKVYLRLRCRPPHADEGTNGPGRNTRGNNVSLAQRIVSKGKKFVALDQPIKEKPKDVVKVKGARSKEKDLQIVDNEIKEKQKEMKYKGKTQADIQAENKAEMHKRLARARAKKAELRRAAMKEKEREANVRASVAAAAIVAQGRAVGIMPRCPQHLAESLQHRIAAARLAPSHQTLPNMNASARLVSPDSPQPVVLEVKESEAPPNCVVGKDLANVTNMQSVAGNVLNRLGKNDSLIVRRNTNVRREFVAKGKGIGDDHGVIQHGMAYFSSNTRADQGGVVETTGPQMNPLSDTRRGVDMKRDIARPHGMDESNFGFYPKDGPQNGGSDQATPRVGFKGQQVVPGDVRDSLRVSGWEARSSLVLPKSIVEDRLMTTGQEARGGVRKRPIPVIELDSDSEDEDENKNIPKGTPEQRTVAKMTTLFQSGRAGDVNARSVPTKWGNMELDAKNEALLTLAQEQKGGVKRRPSTANASGSFDRDTFGRSTKMMCRNNNVPESETKRMIVTAMVAQGRAKRTPISSVSKPAHMAIPNSSLNHLLIGPSAPGPSTSNNPRLTHIDTRMSQKTYPSLERDGSMQMNPDEVDIRAHGELSGARKADGMATSTGRNEKIHLPLASDMQERQANGAQLVELSPYETDASFRPQPPQHYSHWDDPQGRRGGVPRAMPRAHAVNPSSHSGSCSEPGASAAKGITSVYTLRVTKKRPTLAKVGRVERKMTPLLTNRRPSAKSARREIREKMSGSIPSEYYTKPAELSNLRGSAEFRDPIIEQDDPFLRNESRQDLDQAGSSYDNLHKRDEVMHGRDSSLYGSPPQNPYQLNSSGRPSREGNGGTHGYHESQLSGGNTAMAPSQRPHSRGSGRDESMYSSERAGIDEPVYSDSSRRLRRLVAPTLPTAARRLQYEQGRQLARFTPAAPPSEQQQAYSVARRRSSTLRHPDHQSPRGHSSEWDTPASRCAGKQSTPIQSGYSPRTGQNSVLNHEYISKEGVRPILVPVPPVVYEPEGILRQKGMKTGGEGIPRLHDAHVSPTQTRRTIDVNYTTESRPGSEFKRQPVSSTQLPTQPQTPGGTFLQHSRSVGNSPRMETRGSHLPRVGSDGTGDIVNHRQLSIRRGVETYVKSPSSFRRRPTSVAFSPGSLPRVVLREDEPGTARSVQASQQRARTDPSLSNLLS